MFLGEAAVPDRLCMIETLPLCVCVLCVYTCAIQCVELMMGLCTLVEFVNKELRNREQYETHCKLCI